MKSTNVFLLSLFSLLLPATAWADEIAVSTNTETPECIYKIHGGRQNETKYWGTVGQPVESASAALFAFYKVDGTDNQYYIYDTTNKKYLSYTNTSIANAVNQVSSTEKNTTESSSEGTETTTSTVGTKWQITSCTYGAASYFRLQPITSSGTVATFYANWYTGISNCSSSMGWYSDGDNKGSAWTFEPVSGSKYSASISYTLTAEDGGTYTGTTTGFLGSQVVWTGAGAISFTNEKWNENQYSATIAGSAFPFSSSADKTKTYKYIGVKNSNDRLLFASDDYVVMSTNVYPTNQSSSEDSYEWAIILSSVTDGVFKYTVQNKGGKFISIDGAAVNDANTYIKLAETGTEFCYGTCVGTGCGFYVPSTSNFISINSPNSTNQKMFLWTKSSTATHEGSNLGFFDPTDFSTLMANLKTAKEAADKIELSTELGKYCATTTFTTAKTDAASVIAETKYLTASEFNTLISNLSTSALSVNVPQSGKFYTFQCTSGECYVLSTMSKTKTTRLATAKAADNNVADRIFYFDGTNLMGYNNGYYVSMNSEGSGFLGQADAGSTSGTKFTFGSANVSEGSLYVNFNNNGRGLYGKTEGYVDAANPNSTADGYRFIVTEITELPLTIGTNGWSSFSAPVAVSVPSEVKAYYAPNDPAENKLVLEEITNGIIPANTGVVIKGTEGTTVNFSTNITGTATDLSNNKLVCNWCANKIGTGESTNTTDGLYAFATKTSGATKTTGFMKLLTKITLLGHKCYLNTATAASGSTGSAQFIPISLTDDPTGIESAETTTVSDSNAPIYDLQGRKVTCTTKGGMYIQNGKVFIAM